MLAKRLLERSLGIFWERGIQNASLDVPGLARILGVLYITLHFAGTIAFLNQARPLRVDAVDWQAAAETKLWR